MRAPTNSSAPCWPHNTSCSSTKPATASRSSSGRQEPPGSFSRLTHGAARAADEGPGGIRGRAPHIQNLQVRAPFDGFVTLRMNTMAFGGVIFSGAVMPEYRVGDTANPGELIGDLIDTSRSRSPPSSPSTTARTWPRDRRPDLGGCRAGSRPAGEVRSASGVASRQMFGGGTRQYDIAIDVAGDTSRIRPGVSARLAIACQTYDDALHVPRSAVFEVAGKRSVYLRTPTGFEARESRSWHSPRARP